MHLRAAAVIGLSLMHVGIWPTFALAQRFEVSVGTGHAYDASGVSGEATVMWRLVNSNRLAVFVGPTVTHLRTGLATVVPSEFDRRHLTGVGGRLTLAFAPHARVSPYLGIGALVTNGQNDDNIFLTQVLLRADPPQPQDYPGTKAHGSERFVDFGAYLRLGPAIAAKSRVWVGRRADYEGLATIGNWGWAFGLSLGAR